MPEDAKPKHIPHKDRNTAYHMEWQFRREAVTWVDNQPAHLNFYPFATELRNWMLRKPDKLGVFLREDNQFTNQYTYDASVLTYIFQYVINDGADFVKSNVPLDPYEAEIKRIRLYTENVLYTARLCEAFIKQLLFCTTFPEGEYRGSSLGALLSKNCNGCQNSKEVRHKVSLLGSLAHRYHLCHTFDNCLDVHLRIVNRQRDLKAAHSGVAEFSLKSTSEVRAQYDKESYEIGTDLIHMLYHISEIETNMIEEIGLLTGELTQRIFRLIISRD